MVFPMPRLIASALVATIAVLRGRPVPRNGSKLRAIEEARPDRRVSCGPPAAGSLT